MDELRRRIAEMDGKVVAQPSRLVLAEAATAGTHASSAGSHAATAAIAGGAGWGFGVRVA